VRNFQAKFFTQYSEIFSRVLQ